MSDHANAPTISRPRRRPNGMTHTEIVAYEIGLATSDSECLLTTAHVDRFGYGRIKVDGRHRRIHQLVLEEKLGYDLRTGEQANHTCHRRDCIRPEHLYVGTHRDNMRDMVHAGHSHIPKKLSARKVVEIRSRRAAGDLLATLAAAYDVSVMTISSIVRKETWAHLRDE